jgi:hypothetical protein
MEQLAGGDAEEGKDLGCDLGGHYRNGNTGKQQGRKALLQLLQGKGDGGNGRVG